MMFSNINKTLKIIVNGMCIFTICGIVTGINDPLRPIPVSEQILDIILFGAFFSLFYAIINSIVFLFFQKHKLNIIEFIIECCLFYKLPGCTHEFLWIIGGQQPTWYNDIPMSVFFAVVLMILLMNVYICVRNKIKQRFCRMPIYVLQTTDNAVRNLLGHKYNVLAQILLLARKTGRIILYVIVGILVLYLIVVISLFIYGLYYETREMTFGL